MTEPAHAPAERDSKFPLWAQVLVGVILGAVVGHFFGNRPILGTPVRSEHLGQLGTLVIRLLKTLAVPLVFFAILDALARSPLTARLAGKFVLICLVNVTVAMMIGLTLINVFRPGDGWASHFSEILNEIPVPGSSVQELLAKSRKGSLSPLDNISGYVPESILGPFNENNVISVVLLALFAGAALRTLRRVDSPDVREAVGTVDAMVRAGYAVFLQMLQWIVKTAPYAVFGVVAAVVGKSGLEIFKLIWTFPAIIIGGMLIHCLIYYPLAAWFVGGKSPRVYLGNGADAILTGLSCNSSLATVPVTLRSLARMGVSDRSARMAACVGTNLNNDGITLYEAMAGLFLAQAVGIHLGPGEQVAVVLASIMAGAGIAGIPEAGLIVLPLVLGAAGLPDQVIASALPLLMTVDWLIARARTGVNVMADMIVAVLLDAGKQPGPVDVKL